MLAVILFFISLLSVGAWLLNYFKLKQGFRYIALAYGLGAAVISLELFLYFVIFRLSFSFFIYYFISLQTLAALWFVFKKIKWSNNFIFTWHKKYSISLVIGLVVVLFLALNFIQAISKPILAFDGIAFWSMRAQSLIVDKAVNFNSNSYNYLAAFSLKNYPWHYSLLEYWLRLLGGSGGYLNLISWGYLVGLVILIVEAGRRWLGEWQGWVFGLFFVSMPFIYYHSYNNYADITLAYYSAVGMLFFIEWLMNNNQKLLFIAALFSGWAMFVKNEGIFCVIAFVGALFLAKLFKLIDLKWRKIGYGLLFLIFPIAPWLITKAVYGLGFSNVEGAFAWHPEIFYSLSQSLFVSNNWNTWWVIFALGSVIMSRMIVRDKSLLTAWLMFIFLSGGIIAMYAFTEHYLWAMDNTAISRTIIPLASTSIFIFMASLHVLDLKKYE
ncbi:MAG: glycosyltransferase family 39 protein [Candidatus Falkowbacteria bacterium]|nr:glycosyltransferase family 39 protein [Candidatus Falkowbacteria bacterium]